MSITLQSGSPALLDEIVEAVALWQAEGAPVQLHPGDLGWAWRFGTPALAATVRVWRRDGQILAAGTVDREDGLIRMAIAPTVDEDEVFAAQLLADLSDPERGVLPADRGSVEARFGAAFRALLRRSGWVPDEAWTPLRRDLANPVEASLVQDRGLRVEALDADHVDDRLVRDRVAVGRASFPNSTLTVDRWRTMAASSAYRRARCLVAYDGDGNAVAGTTVWSAGPGRPGLIEPLGAHLRERCSSCLAAAPVRRTTTPTRGLAALDLGSITTRRANRPTACLRTHA
ncbi:hypothetical protein GCM10027062_17800 [Nocardioides hungaricus]